jgi:hypothetical protein
VQALRPCVEVGKLPVPPNSAEHDGFNKAAKHRILGDVAQGLAATPTKLKVHSPKEERRCGRAQAPTCLPDLPPFLRTDVG